MIHRSPFVLALLPVALVAQRDAWAPVLYLLDGEIHFRYTAAIVDFLAANDRIPKMVVIGIDSGDSRTRTRDLTPPSIAGNDNRFSQTN